MSVPIRKYSAKFRSSNSFDRMRPFAPSTKANGEVLVEEDDGHKQNSLEFADHPPRMIGVSQIVSDSLPFFWLTVSPTKLLTSNLILLKETLRAGRSNTLRICRQHNPAVVVSA